MNATPCAIYRRLPLDLAARLQGVLARAAEARSGAAPATVWFRADDIGVPGRQFGRMLATFTAHRVPLAPALVPAWLTASRWHALQRQGSEGAHLWGWHQHGWRHLNHQPGGKKQEFGPARSAAALESDLVRGCRRLEAILGDAFLPLFTPPWNRCSAEALAQLKALGFRAVSRSSGAKPSSPEGLVDLFVNVDLHTRKATRAQADWAALLAELEAALTVGWCGIMLHHQRMNGAAFDFLDILLQHMAKQQHFRIVHLKTLLESPALPPADVNAN
jgi:predicted deacetylase